MQDIKSVPHNTYDDSEYYDINKDFSNESNNIDGLYIDPPFT